MKAPLRRATWILGVAMLACALAAWAIRPVGSRDKNFDLETPIPRVVGEWRIDPSVVPVAPTPDVQANLDQIYDRILMRTYVNDRGDRMMLVIAYGGDQSDSLKAHRQEVCYSAQGFGIRSVDYATERIAGRSIDVARIHAVKGARHEPVTYWFTMGETVAMSRVARLRTQVSYAMRGRVPDGMLVRVSSIDSDSGRAFALQRDFLDALVRAAEAGTQVRLVGAAHAG